MQFHLILGGPTSNFKKGLCLVKWLKEVQKGCSVFKHRKAAVLSNSFIFYAAFRATGIPLKPTWLYIFSFGIKLVHVGVPTVFAIVGI